MPNGHIKTIRNVVFSPDMRTLASCSEDKTISLWRLSDAKEILILQGHTSIVNQVIFSKDGKILVSCSEDNTVCLWMGQDGKMIRIIKQYRNKLMVIAFSLIVNKLLLGALMVLQSFGALQMEKNCKI